MMSFQDKYDEYKQRQEARKFFNQNNDVKLSSTDYIKVVLVGIVVATGGAIITEVLQNAIGWRFAICDLIIGYLVGLAMKKVGRYGSQQLAFMAVVCYFIGFILGITIYVMHYWAQLVSWSFMLSNGLLMEGIKTALSYVFTGDLLATLFIIFGAGMAYSVAKD